MCFLSLGKIIDQYTFITLIVNRTVQKAGINVNIKRVYRINMILNKKKIYSINLVLKFYINETL